MTKQSKTSSTITAGGLSSAIIGVIEICSFDEIISASIIILCPFIVSMVVWSVTRLLARIEPFSEEEAKEISKINNGIREIDKALKTEKVEEDKKFLRDEKRKLVSKRTEIQLGK